MHISENEIRAFHDQELDAREHTRVAAHLSSCQSCRDTSQMVLARSRRVGSHLAVLEPGPLEAPLPTGQARQKFEHRLNTKETPSMLNRIFSAKFRPALAMIALALILLVGLSIPSVRAAAGDLLGLFRVQEIQVVEFDPANLPVDLDRGTINVERLFSDQVRYEEPTEIFDVGSAAEASQLAGFQVRMPAGVTPTNISYQSSAWLAMDVDLERFQLLFSELGRSDLSLPESLDGETISLNVPASVTAAFGECAPPGEDFESARMGRHTCTVLVQMASPSIDAPPGLEIDQIGETFLQIFGMSPQDAADFSSRVDWTTTLIIPVPEGSDYSEVNVDGVEGTLFLESYGPDRSRYSIMWVKDGMVYALVGEGDLSAVLEMANSLR